MGKRKLPFGYVMINGDVEPDPKAASCVNWIYMTYLAGASLKSIAAELNVRKHKAYDGERLWNKNMIDRILQDQRYSGDAIYPEIISTKLYESVQRQRAERGGLPRHVGQLVAVVGTPGVRPVLCAAI